MREYQYETSPRKLEPEYNIQNKKKTVKKSKQEPKTKAKVLTKAEKRKKALEDARNKVFLFINLLVICSVLFLVIYRDSLISQTFSQIQTLKNSVTDIQKENDQIEISIQNSLNLSSVEQSAKELLGMQKLTSKQTVYLNLPKKDFVEPSSEEIIIEENNGIFTKIIEFISNMF